MVFHACVLTSVVVLLQIDSQVKKKMNPFDLAFVTIQFKTISWLQQANISISILFMVYLMSIMVRGLYV